MDDPRRLIRDASNRMRRGGSEPDFFEFVRRLENSIPGFPRIGRAHHASREPLRFGQEPCLKFPETSIAKISPSSHSGHPLILVYFFGLLGVNGPMPLEFTNFVFQRSRNSLDRTLQAFADVIHHRMIALFYRAWAANEEAVQFDRPEDDLATRALLALAGCPGTEADLELPPYAARANARFLSRLPRTAGGLAKVLSSFLGERVEVEDRVEGEFDMPAEYRCRLGDRKVALLGGNAQIGSRCVSRSRLFRVKAGPMPYGRAAAFFPGGKAFGDIVRLTRFYLDKPREFTLRIEVEVAPGDARPLGRDAALGRGVWLGGHEGMGTLDFPVPERKKKFKENRRNG